MSALQVRETTACLPLSTHLSMTRFTRISAGLEQPPNQLELKENFEKKTKNHMIAATHFKSVYGAVVRIPCTTGQYLLKPLLSWPCCHPPPPLSCRDTAQVFSQAHVHLQQEPTRPLHESHAALKQILPGYRRQVAVLVKSVAQQVD